MGNLFCDFSEGAIQAMKSSSYRRAAWVEIRKWFFVASEVSFVVCALGFKTAAFVLTFDLAD
jgi:hypothetical protein